MLVAIALATAPALTVADLRQPGFYVEGVTQGMSQADYNALIANGGFKSEPLDRDYYHASIRGHDIYVTFCKGKVVAAMTDYTSADWAKSLMALEGAGIAITKPYTSLSPTAGSSAAVAGSVSFGATIPKGFAFAVMPTIKFFTARERDFPAFQLSFVAIPNECQANS